MFHVIENKVSITDVHQLYPIYSFYSYIPPVPRIRHSLDLTEACAHGLEPGRVHVKRFGKEPSGTGDSSVLTKTQVHRGTRSAIAFFGVLFTPNFKSRCIMILMKHCVYLIRAGDFIKIGHTSNLEKRLEALCVGTPMLIELSVTFYCGSKEDARKSEKNLHRFFKFCHVRGEWFDANQVLSVLQNECLI